jgi:RES domain
VSCGPEPRPTLPPTSPLHWERAHRIIAIVYPPVHLFEDLTTDPADWDLLASLEAKTNPRVRDQLGDLSLVPPARRVFGPTASIAMAPFCHVSPARPGRFHDGSFGAWYCGDRFEVALMETVHHAEAFFRRTAEPAAETQRRELVCGLRGVFHDLRGGGFEACLDPEDYAPAQALARRLRAANADGIVYPSVRWPEGLAAAAFWPDLLRLPIIQARHLLYRWNGSAVTHYLVYGEADWAVVPGRT